LKLLKKLRQLTPDDQEIYALLYEGFDGILSIGHSGSKELVFRTREHPDEPYLTLCFKGNRITRLTPGNRLTQQCQNDLVERAKQALQEDAGSHVVSRYIFAERPLKGQFQVSDHLRLRPPPLDTVIGSGLDEWQKVANPFDENSNSHLGPPYPILMEIKVKKSSASMLQSLWVRRELKRHQNALTLLLAPDIKYAHFPSGPLWISFFREQRIENHLLDTGFSDPHGGNHDDFPASQEPILKTYDGADYYGRLWVWDTELLIPKTLGLHLDLMHSLNVKQANKFHRACMWFAQGVQFRLIETISIPSFSTSIECLLPPGEEITKNFETIVERYGQLTDGTKPLAKQLYDVRSELIHGSFAHSSDKDMFTFKNDDWQTILMWIVAKRCLIGWLEDPKKVS
jgi:Apea-like HEPN